MHKRKKTETKTFPDFLRQVMPEHASEATVSPSLPPPPPPKTCQGTQTDVRFASVTSSTLPVFHSTSIKEFKSLKKERLDGDDKDEDVYDDDENFVQFETRGYGRENVGPVASPYLMPYCKRGVF